MLKIKLNDNRWIKTCHGHVLGSAFINDTLLNAEEIDAYLCASSENQLADRLFELNGRWSVCLKLTSGEILVATDRTRTWPLYYTAGTSKLFLSDCAEEVRAVAGDTETDPIACEEFLHICCVSGHDTLFPHVKQMSSGEMLLVRQPEEACNLDVKRWYTFKPEEPDLPLSMEEYLERLDSLMLAAHQRLIDYADGRPIYIPLSGGLDSRSVATTLVRLKYDNLYTYCYGDPTANDTRISKEVAKKLKLPWIHIPYSKQIWREEFQKPYFQQYLQRYFQYSAVPNIQELPAARILNETILPNNAIIAPGHSDAYMGSNALPYLSIPNELQLYRMILQKNYTISTTPLSQNINWNQRIDNALGNPPQYEFMPKANGFFEQWFVQEIANKLHISTMLAHIFWGTQVYYPLCDSVLLDFWEKVPHNLRFNRKLQLAYVQKHYTAVCGEDPFAPIKTDRDRSVPQAPRVILKKWRFLIPPILKYVKRHILLHKNKWAYHYAFPFSFRHQCVKQGNLAVHYMYALYLMQRFLPVK